MKPDQRVIKLSGKELITCPTKEPGRINIIVYQEKNPKQYFTKLTQRFMQCSMVEFRLLWKGNRAENKLAASLGKFISIQQVPEVIQKLAGTQFSLSCQSQPGNIMIDIAFNLYDDNVEILCTDSLEEQIISFFSDENNSSP